MLFFFSSRRRHTRLTCDWSSDVCSSDLVQIDRTRVEAGQHAGDRGLDQLLVGDRLDRVLADPLEGLAEKIELLVDAALAGLLLRQRGCWQQQNGQSRGEKPLTHKFMPPKAGAHYPSCRVLQSA